MHVILRMNVVRRLKFLFQDKHPWVRKSMGNVDMRRMKISGQPVCSESLPVPSKPKRKPRSSGELEI